MVHESEISGARAPLHMYCWDQGSPRYVAVLVHGYGEHAGRYEHVASALGEGGAVVYAVDYPGHGKSDGEPALIDDLDTFVIDTERVVAHARQRHPGLPLVLIGHSLGGVVATRYAQKQGDGLAALVLSGPVIGGNPDILGLVALPEIPEIPIDPSILSRDPAVGQAYAEDPLVYHGPFKRTTLEAIVAAVERVAAGGSVGDVPTLWIHGESDALAPLAQARDAIERVRGSALEEIVYPGARHEVFNETNKVEVLADVTRFIEGALSKARADAANDR
jgi:alpha-beta hydrolase superfamily lysophospholipase